mmetsp:Transcript_7806/g.17620  ORF Transcript_7806/g.17620 Transcript_7806/m.17620 type:complete len:102 (+) Transcript_7806:184-489(+)
MDVEEISQLSNTNTNNENADVAAAASFNRQRIDWSADTKMKDAVMKWDEIVIAWKEGKKELDAITSEWGKDMLAKTDRDRRRRILIGCWHQLQYFQEICMR